MIDYRSDTVTKPSKEMLDAMFNAKVGDDVYQEDPTVNELQEFAADFFGMEAALFCSSGTQSNQIGINIHVQRGGEVICHEESHIYKYEGGGIARNTSASVRLLKGDRGRITAEDGKNNINPDDIHFPPTALVSLEDTANRGSGAIYDFEEIKKISQFCRSINLPLHLDGARLMNALVVNKIDPKEYASQFDSISICLSKGLGAPIGSLLLGTKSYIQQARRVRKVMGGGMRQAGYIAAAGLYALKNNVQRLEIDHQNAKNLEKALIELDWVKKVMPVVTNIIILEVESEEIKNSIILSLKDQGILCISFGPTAIRFVTHLDISVEDIEKTISALKNIKHS